MCEPVSIGAGLMAASTVMGGVSEKGQKDYQAGVAKQNQKLEQIKAQQALQSGRQEAAAIGQESLQHEGAVRASAAARGVVVDEGSAAVGVQDVAAAGARDRLTTLINARRQMRAHQQEAANLAAEREALQAEGKAALFGSVLSAGGQVASAWTPKAPTGGDPGPNVVTTSSGKTYKRTSGK